MSGDDILFQAKNFGSHKLQTINAYGFMWKHIISHTVYSHGFVLMA